MSKPSVRDEKAAYKAALIEEYEGYKYRGRQKEAAKVAAVLKKHYDHEVEKPAKKTAKKAAAPERADVEKAPENTAEPKPKHKG